MRYLIPSILTTLITCVTANLWAGVGETAGQTLLRGSGARATGLGGAYVSIAEDVQAAAYNPASLSKLPTPEISSTFSRGFANDSLGTIDYGHPIPFGSLYIGGIYLDAGRIDINLSDGTQASRRSQQDLVGILGIGIGRNFPLSVGINAKAFRFELAEEYEASGYAFDAGLLWTTPLSGFNLGASAQNMGPDITYVSDKEDLPLTVRFGASYLWDLGMYAIFKRIPFNILFSADGVQVKEEDTSTHAGLELYKIFNTPTYEGKAAFRLGYVSEPESFVFGLGAGAGPFKLDYSINTIDQIDPSHRVTISWAFYKKDRFKMPKEYKNLQLGY